MTQPQELVGTFIVEVGERQAWPFVTFCDNDTTPSREARLYIDTEFTVNGSNDVSLEGDSSAARLFALNCLGVTAVEVNGAELSIALDDGNQLVVSGVASAWTTGDVWWLGPWRV